MGLRISKALLVGVCTCCGLVAQAADPPAEMPPIAEAQAAAAGAVDGAPAFNPFSLTISVDVPTQYFGRGVHTENQGFICQPAVELGVALLEEGEGPVRSLALVLGTFHSFHTGPTGAEGDFEFRDFWNEADFLANVSIGLFDHFELAFGYSKVAHPNKSAVEVDEIGIGLAWDDSGLWEDLGVELSGFEGLQPSVTLAFETHGQSDPGLDEGTYIEFALDPHFTIGETSWARFGIRTPFAIGFSIENYYEDEDGDDDTFGFVQVGLTAECDLSCLPACMGAWQIHAGVSGLWLGDHATEYNFGDDFELIATAGLTVAF